MKSCYRYILLLITAGYSVLAGQDNPAERDNTFSVSAGLTEYQTKEFVLNKVKHRGMFPSLTLAYNIPSDEARHNIELDLLFNQLSSSFESETATIAIRTGLHYSYLKKVSRPAEQMELYLGGAGGADYNVSYFENWDESHFYWLTQYYIAAAGRLNWQQSSGGLWLFEMQLPLLSLQSRPAQRFASSEVDPQFSAIAGDMHSDLQWVSLKQHIDLRLAVYYSFALSDSFRPTLSWRFSYLNNRLANSRQLTILTHTFGIVFYF